MSLSAADWTAYVAGVVGHAGYVDRFAEEIRLGGVRVPITHDDSLRNEAIALGKNILWLHTNGKHGSAPSGVESVLDANDVVPLPRYEVSVQKTPVPDTISYDAPSRTLSLGTGEWRDVDPRVWEYTVGSKNVIHSWFGYRKRIPAGRKSSDLDKIVPMEWPSEWSREFHTLLATLTWLIHLEPQQEALLDAIVAGPVLTVDDLLDLGVVFPSKSDRKPQTDDVLDVNQNSVGASGS